MAKSSDESSGYEFGQTVVLLIGVYEGVLPFASKIFDWTPFLSLPLRLDSPWWWIVSGLVVVVGAVALEALERAKKRAEVS